MDQLPSGLSGHNHLIPFFQTQCFGLVTCAKAEFIRQNGSVKINPMLETTVVFVHGFMSNPECWNPFVKRLEKDDDFGKGYRFSRFQYPTKFGEANPSKRIPGIDECGNALGDFLDRQPEFDQLFLFGHSMGGLVIESFLAQKIRSHRGTDLAKIRSVILFATPNRGATV